MNTEAFPWASLYIISSKNKKNAVSRHEIMPNCKLPMSNTQLRSGFSLVDKEPLSFSNFANCSRT